MKIANSAFDQMFSKAPETPLLIKTASPFVALKPVQKPEKKAPLIDERQESLEEIKPVVHKKPEKKQVVVMDLEDIAEIKQNGWEVDQTELEKKEKMEQEKLKKELEEKQK